MCGLDTEAACRDATSVFLRVASAVTLMRERRDPALTAFIAAHGFGVSRQELEAMGLPQSISLEGEM